MRAVCDWCERCCGVSAVGVQWLWNWVRGEVDCLLVMFERSELTRAFEGTHVCDCGIIGRLMVLGVQQQRAGAIAFRGGGEGGQPCCVGEFVTWL